MQNDRNVQNIAFCYVCTLSDLYEILVRDLSHDFRTIFQVFSGGMGWDSIPLFHSCESELLRLFHIFPSNVDY